MTQYCPSAIALLYAEEDNLTLGSISVQSEPSLARIGGFEMREKGSLE